MLICRKETKEDEPLIHRSVSIQQIAIYLYLNHLRQKIITKQRAQTKTQQIKNQRQT